MSASSRLGLVLFLILVAWAVAYWYNVRHLTMEMGREEGVALRPMDTVGINPDTIPPTPPPTITPDTTPIRPQPQPENDTPPSNREVEIDDPPDMPPEVEIPPPPLTFPYVVTSGDTMESIASGWFGSKSKWVLISQENPFVDPLKLRRGDELRLPAKNISLQTIAPEELKRLTEGKRYVVSSGDSLWGIAKRFYGNGALSTIIANANRDVLPNPDDLQLGIELRIPPHQIPAE